MNLTHIASRIFNTPLLVHPGKLDAIVYGLQDRLGVHTSKPMPGMFTTDTGGRKDPGYRVIGKIGVLDIFGVMAHRGGMAADSSWVLGYQEISRMLTGAKNDSQVECIVMNFDSPGGEASPVPELADQIREIATNIKPVHAIASCHMHSAAMWLGAAANSISITRMGYAGSIGVVLRHVDMSKKLEKAGLSVTHIYAGDHKIDGHPYAALPDDVREDLQKEIDTIYGMFVTSVAQYRNISEEQVRDTEARSFMGLEAVAAGLADRTETPDHMIARLNKEFSTTANSARIFTTSEDKGMIEEKTPDTPVEKTEQQAAIDTPEVTATDSKPTITAEDLSQAVAAARAEERTRFATIMSSEAAKGRTASAVSLATKTDMSVNDVLGMLAGMPAQIHGSGKLDEAMANIDQPGIGSEGEGEGPAVANPVTVLEKSNPDYPSGSAIEPVVIA
ncbi:S49 family peptidase [Candidatus Vondammii sp. HM_W22]|uniref:S49 family peptidase n=1 Tax=Candidatus Vondammii sp. HM_W22 TaxID=2687299 RepID=UPI001F13C60C|nr:S49 family peptidase [Candidatus Vondammii sp. HM_W22]